MAERVEAKIESNAIILVLTEILVKAFGLVLAIFVARMLGAEKFGLLAFSYALSGICLVLPDFGFDRLTVREVARRTSRASQFLVNISAVKGLLYLPMAGFCALIVLLGPHAEGSLFVVLVIFLVAATQQHLLFGCSFFRAMQKMEHEALVRLILAVLLLFTGFGVLSAGFGLKGLVVSQLVVSVLCVGFTIILLRQTLGIRFEKVNWRYTKTLVKLSAPLSIFVILSILFNSMNVIILAFLKGDLSTGYYSAAFRIVSVFFVISLGVSRATMPVLSTYLKDSSQKFVRTFQKSVRYLLLLSIPLCLGTFLLGGKAVSLIFGDDYLPSLGVIKVLAFLILPCFLNDIVSATLIPAHKEKVMVAGSIVGVAAVLGLCFILIPQRGAVGAALALVIADTIVFFFRFPAVFREFGVRRQLVTTGKALLAASLMGVVLVWFISAGMLLPLLVGVSVLVYAGTLLVLGEVRLHELKSVWGSLLQSVRSFLQSAPFRETDQ